jgi:hypothetical protein
MKIINLVSKSHQSFASVFLAFSLFGFVFPHHVTGVKQTHQVNLKASEQTGQTKRTECFGGFDMGGRHCVATDDSEPRYKNPRVNAGQPYTMGLPIH